MDGKMKMFIAVACVFGILSLTFLATPALAYSNGASDADQDRTRLRTRDQMCDGNMLQTQNREQLRTQTQGCNNDCDTANIQLRERNQTGNRFCNCEKAISL
jgi:hypothetical protein